MATTILRYDTFDEALQVAIETGAITIALVDGRLYRLCPCKDRGDLKHVEIERCVENTICPDRKD